MSKVILFSSLLLLLSSVSACGWFTYEDIKGTRAWYSGYDKLSFIEDSVLQQTRFPTYQEKQMNVYIPMNYNKQNGNK